MTSQNQKSPLLKLPAELRNKIYHYVFSGHVISMPPEVIGATHVRVYKKKNCLTKHAIPEPNLLALTKTCCQLHRETRLLLFKLSEIGINTYSDAEFEGINAFLDHLPKENRTAITKICVLSTLEIMHLHYTRWYRLTRMVMYEKTERCEEFNSIKPLRHLLARLEGLKSILVLEEVCSSHHSKQEVPGRMKEVIEEGEKTGRWMQSLTKGRQLEVVVKVKTVGA